MLGVTLPKFLSDAEADRLMDLILGSRKLTWNEQLKLIGQLATMTAKQIADVKMVRSAEQNRIRRAVAKRPQILLAELVKKALVLEDAKVAPEVDTAWKKALWLDSMLRLLASSKFLDDRQVLDILRALNLGQRGDVRCDLGDSAGAVRDYSVALALYDLPHVRGRRDHDPNRIWIYVNRGKARARLGDLREATADYDAALALCDLTLLMDRCDFDLNRATIHMSRGDARADYGDSAKALEDYNAALVFLNASELMGRRDLDPDRARACMNRGTVLRAVGEPAEAIGDYDAVLTLYDLPNMAGREERDLQRALAFMNRGNARRQLGESAGAIADFAAALALYELPHLKKKRELDLHRARARTNRGIAQYVTGNFAEAVKDFNLALALFDTLTENRRTLDRDRAVTLLNRATVRLHLTDFAGALADYRDADRLLSDPSGVGAWRHFDSDRVAIWAKMALLLALMEDDQVWASDRSGRFREILELAPPWTAKGSDPWESVRSDFAWFHAWWLKYCIDTDALDHVPGIVSAIQGRELASRILDELGELEREEELPEALKAYQDLRRLLREKAEEIRRVTDNRFDKLADSAGGGRRMALAGFGSIRDRLAREGLGDDGLGFGVARPSLAHEAGFATSGEDLSPHPYDAVLVRRLDEEYRALHGRLADVREAAAREPGHEALIPPRFDAAQLVDGSPTVPGSGLATDEALVLLLDVAPSGLERIGIEGALVLRHGREPAWCPLPGVRTLAGEIDEVSDRLGASTRLGGGFRYAGRRADGGAGSARQVATASEATPSSETQSPPEGELTSELPTQPETDLSAFWEVMEGRLREQVWRPLEEALAGISQVVCVTQGRLHLLPLELGAPKGKTLRHYPGLVYYGYSRGLLGRNENRQSQSRSHTNSEAASPPPAVGLVGYGGEQDSIPFVWGEVDALKRLHEERHRSVRTGDPYDHRQDGSSPASPTEYALLHLACHGIPVGEGMRERVVLQLGPGRLLDMGRIMESRVKVDQVLIAACLGGKVREDLDGEPSGVVGGYLYRGSSEVAAAVVALPDSWTMLASILIHQAWLESGSLGEAVTEGKRRLAEGDWYPDTERLFGEAANAALTAWRERNRGPLRRRLVHALTYDGNRWKQLVAPLKTAGAPDRYDPSALREGAEGEAWGERIQTVAAEVADRLLDLDPLRHAVDEVLSRRVPPQPLLGAITHGIRTFGEAAFQAESRRSEFAVGL